MIPFPLSPAESWAAVIGIVAASFSGAFLWRALVDNLRAARGNGATGSGRVLADAPAPPSEEDR